LALASYFQHEKADIGGEAFTKSTPEQSLLQQLQNKQLEEHSSSDKPAAQPPR